MNVDIDIVQENDRYRPSSSEVNRLYGDNSRLLKYTDWQPKYSGLDGFRRGLSITCSWFCNPDNLRLYKPDNYVV